MMNKRSEGGGDGWQENLARPHVKYLTSIIDLYHLHPRPNELLTPVFTFANVFKRLHDA